MITSLSFESKTEIQLLVVDILNTGGGATTTTATTPFVLNPHMTLSNSFRMQESAQLLSNYKAYPALYHLNLESTKEPSPYIAMDSRTGRHFVYDNDDRIMVFSH